jgi:phosphate starvation-inducible protein PhoH
MKKKINIVLFVAVVSLWGGVLYRIVKNYMVSSENKELVEQKITSIPISKLKKDTFEFQPLSRDPFLNTIMEKKVFSNQHVRKTKVELDSKDEVKENSKLSMMGMPHVQYYGKIQSKNDNQELYLLKINGKLIRFKKGTVVEGVKLSKIYKDSIEIAFGRSLKTIKKG